MIKNTMNAARCLAGLLMVMPLTLSACHKREEAAHHEQHTIVATRPEIRDVTIIQPYVCQIHSQRHIEVRALERGYLEQIPVKEGQTVKSGDLLFKVLPNVYQAKFDAETAEAELARLELKNTEGLLQKNVVSPNAVKLLEAKLAKAQANAQQAGAELNFTKVTAPFDGIIDRLMKQQGSLVEEGEILTTLSDNNVMWVYFNMPEKRYLEYKANLAEHKDDLKVELVLADHSTFPHAGAIGAIEADFNNETGNIAFRADFPNPEGLLRHGQTGKVLIQRVLKDAVVIPQRATFEILAKRYVYVVDKDNIARQREIGYDHELDDIFVIKEGLATDEKIVLEGVRQIRDGDEVEYEEKEPSVVMTQLKNRAE